MKIWFVRDLEPLPTDPGNPRLLRAGLLAATFASLGHETTWFTSTFNHYSRRQRAAGRLRPGERLTIEVLAAPGYRRNIGLGRLVHNRRFARAFARRAGAAREMPDVVIADLPTTDAAAAAVAFGLSRRIPTVVTVRDLWPDFFAHFVPAALRPAVRLATWPLDRQARFACRHATALLGISERYLAWGRKKGDRPPSEADRVFPLGYHRPPAPAEDEAQATLRRLGIAPRRHVVAFVGSWGATYDLPLVMEAARRLAHRKDILFVLAGNADERPNLKRAFEALDNVLLPGWLGRDEVAALLGRAALGLLPYAAHAPQGLPNKVFEYMAYGTFQIATLAGEAEALYAETGTGLSIQHGSPAALARAIEATLADARKPEGRARRAAVFDARFDARAIYRAMAEHIEAVVRKQVG